MTKPVNGPSNTQHTHSTSRTDSRSTHTGLIAGKISAVGPSIIQKQAQWQVAYKPSKEVLVSNKLGNEVGIVSRNAVTVAKRQISLETAGEAPFKAPPAKRQKH